MYLNEDYKFIEENAPCLLLFFIDTIISSYEFPKQYYKRRDEYIE